MMEPAHLVGLGGAIGAVCRYALVTWLATDRFPFGTLLVNVTGSALLGAVTASGLHAELVLLVGVGAVGSFTTFSSFSVETVRLWETGDRLRAGMYAFGTLGASLVAAGVAFSVVRVIVS